MANHQTLLIKRAVADMQPLLPLLQALGLPTPSKPHVTLIHSKALVDWDLPVFAPDVGPLDAMLIHPRLETFGPERDILALVFDQPILAARRQALERFGARSDWPDYRPHVSLGAAPARWQDRARHLTLPNRLLFAHETRKAI